MEYVYVVTMSARGADKGEFFGRPTAFEQQVSAQRAARVCRETLGGRFELVDITSLHPDNQGDHIVQRWDSDEWSVWVERLVFEPWL